MTEEERYIQYEKDNIIYIHIDAFCGYCDKIVFGYMMLWFD